MGSGRVQAGLSRPGTPDVDPPERGIPLAPGKGGPRLHAGLLPVRSHLLRESLLVSFPPLNNMLKFGGLSPLTRGRIWRDLARLERYRGGRRRQRVGGVPPFPWRV